MKNPLQPEDHVLHLPEKLSWWQRLGGGPLSLAIMIHVILALIAGVWITTTVLDGPPPPPDIPLPRQPKGSQTNSRSPIAPSNRPDRVITDIPSNTALPEPTGELGKMAALQQLGGPLSGSPGSGDGSVNRGFEQGSESASPNPFVGPKGSKNPFSMIDVGLSKRCSKEDRLSRLKENGGTPACEEAVLKGLRWMKANQNPDGSWGTANRTAMTGLALLAYFGHCETPISDEFGESCLKGIVYLVDVGVKNNGVLVANVKTQNGPYEHGIGTYALGEAATFCKELGIPSLADVTQKAGQFIIDHQHANGGWAYSYSKEEKAHTDSSVVGWQLQALKACKHTHLDYTGMDSAVSKGLNYLSGLQNENGGFGYINKANPQPGLTGVGVLCFQMWGKEKSEVRDGIKFLKENVKLDWKTKDSDLYAHYYISQAMMQAGRGHWSMYNNVFRDQLLANQGADGSWEPPASTAHGQSAGNAVYRNALCILMLEVYYRFLNTSSSPSQRQGI